MSSSSYNAPTADNCTLGSSVYIKRSTLKVRRQVIASPTLHASGNRTSLNMTENDDKTELMDVLCPSHVWFGQALTFIRAMKENDEEKA